MSVSYASNKLRVPPGFEHLLEGLAREILREQPKNLVEFAAQYFRNKLQERDGKGEETSTDLTTSQIKTSEPSSEVVPISAENNTTVPTVAKDEEPAKPMEQEEEQETKAGDEDVTEGGISKEGPAETSEGGDGDEEVVATEDETNQSDAAADTMGGSNGEDVSMEDDSTRPVPDTNESGVEGENQTTASEADRTATTEETQDPVQPTVLEDGGNNNRNEGGEDTEQETAANPTE